MLAGYCSLCDEQCVGWVELTDVVVGRSICISTTSPSIISVSSLQQEGEREREKRGMNKNTDMRKMQQFDIQGIAHLILTPIDFRKA